MSRKKEKTVPKHKNHIEQSSQGRQSLAAGFEWKHVALIISVCMALYANTLTMDFVWDDLYQIKENSQIRSLKNIHSLFTSNVWAGVKGLTSNYYRPVFSLSLALDYFFWKDAPFGYHLTNVLLHAIVSCIVYITALRLLQSNKAAIFSGLIFAVHPVHSEAVSWVSARNEMLSAFFMLGSFYLYIIYSGNKRLVYMILSLFSFFFALLSKEMAVTLPLIILFYAIFLDKIRLKRAMAYFLIYCLILAVYFTVRTSILQGSWVSPPLLQRIYTTPGIIAEYLRLLVLPAKLKVFYDVSVKKTFFSYTVIIPVLVISATALLLVFLRKFEKRVFFGAIFTLIALLPVSGLIVFTSPSLIAERYLYIPSIGFSFAVGALFSFAFNNTGNIYPKQENISSYKGKTSAGKNKILPISVGILLIGVSAFLTFTQNYKWADDYTFMKQMVKDAPESAFAHFSLGATADRIGSFGEAIYAYQSAIALEPTYVKAHNNLGIVYAKLERYADAITEYQAALRINPDNFESRNNLGIVFEKVGRYEEAISEYQSALRIKPDNLNSHRNLGHLYRKLARPEESVRVFQGAIKLMAEDPALHNSLGVVFLEQNQLAAALTEFQTAVRLSPDYAEAHNNLGLVYRRQQRMPEAIIEFQTSTALNSHYAEAYNNLGVAYAIQGRIDNAIINFKKALQQEPGNAVFKKNFERASRQRPDK